MSSAKPVQTTNLDECGPAPIDWERALSALEATAEPGADVFTVLGTTGPDGRPHAAPVGALWIDGAFHVVSGASTRKSRRLEANPACTLTARLRGLDLVIEGDAPRVTGAATLERIARVYRDHGWPADIEGDTLTASYTAPSAGSPPWPVYRIVAGGRLRRDDRGTVRSVRLALRGTGDHALIPHMEPGPKS